MSDTTTNDLIKKALILETQERTEFLNQLEDGATKQKIELLLNDDIELTNFIVQTSHGATPLENHQIKDLQAGDKIKQFIIVKLIAKGGMGSVYLAYDEKLKRNVAIKTIRSEYLKNQVTQQRFKQEAQILSQINHPSICQIYDYIDYKGGNLLVLELVKGVTLSNINLNEKQQLEVFIQIASALVAAHNKDVIHRDLKPDNIMRTNEDEIKVLDFGIAKSKVAGNFKDESFDNNQIKNNVITKMGTMMGTLLYMSPEQAEGKAITKASDIYSFGIIMQEMLTSVTVYDLINTKDLKQQVIEAEKVNSDLVPKKFKNLIASLNQKEPILRPTANEVLRNLQEIKEIPIRRFKRFSIASIVFLSILGFSKYTYDLNQQKNQAQAARILAENAQFRAEQAKIKSEQVTEFLSSLFGQSDPFTNNGNPKTVREMLDEGAKRIDEELIDQPKVLVKLKLIIGRVYFKLGLFPKAREQFEQAQDILLSKNLAKIELQLELKRFQALVEMSTSHLNKATELQQQILLQAEQHGLKNTKYYLDAKFDLGVVQSKRGEFTAAKKIYNELLVIYNKNKINNTKNIIQIYNSLGQVNWSLKKLVIAEKQMQHALSMFPENENQWLETKISVLNNLINISSDGGKHQQAIDYGEQALQLRIKVLPTNHPNIALNYDNLAIAYCRFNNIQKCKEYNAKALEIYVKSVGKNHLDYAFTLANRAAILSLEGNYSGAVSALTETVNTLMNLHQRDHFDTAYYLTSLGKAYYYTDDIKNAIKYFEESNSMYQRLDNPIAYDLLDTLTMLGRAHEKDNNNKAAIKIYTKKLQILKEENKDSKAISETQIKLKNLRKDPKISID